MKFTAVISEYNPFHNGHDFQKNLIKKDQASHYMVAIMSGNFTQRGEPAIFDKWTRAYLALICGVDIVVELPALYALQSAEGFASGGVAIANGLNVINELCFGSESADIQKLKKAAHSLEKEDSAFKTVLKNSLSGGMSFPSARTAALRAVLGGDTAVLSSPNDILAVEYLKALFRSQSPIRPHLIRREGASYTDPDLSGMISSAFSIRRALKKGDIKAALSAVPKPVRSFFEKHLAAARPVFPEDFFNQLIYKLRFMSKEEIAAVAGVSEGLQHKIKKSAGDAKEYADLLSGVKSKRYTQTRISRIFMSCLLGITQNMLDEANTYAGLYARILGYRKDALSAFSHLCKKSRIPVITAGTQLPVSALAKTDILASDIYSLACTDQTAGKDFTQKLIVV
jgi:predicted nucleotidyltransferase